MIIASLSEEQKRSITPSKFLTLIGTKQTNCYNMQTGLNFTILEMSILYYRTSPVQLGLHVKHQCHINALKILSVIWEFNLPEKDVMMNKNIDDYINKNIDYIEDKHSELYLDFTGVIMFKSGGMSFQSLHL